MKTEPGNSENCSIERVSYITAIANAVNCFSYLCGCADVITIPINNDWRCGLLCHFIDHLCTVERRQIKPYIIGIIFKIFELVAALLPDNNICFEMRIQECKR